jgi:serpin B
MMRLIIAAVFTLALTTTRTLATCPQGSLDEAKTSEMAQANFAVNFYKEVSAGNQDKNVVLSPLSVALALAVLESGASGVTKNKVKSLLLTSNGTSAPLDVLTAYSSLQRQLNLADEKTKLTVVNGIFPQKDFPIKSEYISAIEDCFGGEVEKLDFREQMEESRRKINRWVSEKTQNKIPELFKPNTLSGNVAMVLANALYFKGQWRYGFPEEQTKPGTFYRFGRQSETQTVNFMKMSAWFGYASDDTVETVQLSYTNRDLSMYVFLPKTENGGSLARFERELTGEKLKNLINNVRTQYIQVSLPRFGIRSSTDLETHLRDLGLDVIFSDRADFSQISTAPLKVSKALHEAYVKINEDGTEASASTGFVWIARSSPPNNPPKVIVDHPFIYAIKHKPTGAILFLGRVNFIEDN